jgi:hypothetical protein
MLTMDDYKLIAQSKYTAYTMKRLDERYELLSNVIAHPDALDDEIADAAIERKKVLACINLFIEEDIDDPRATAARILNIKFGDGAVQRLAKRTVGGEVAQDLLSKTGTGLKTTAVVTKKGLNGFATWLANATK